MKVRGEKLNKEKFCSAIKENKKNLLLKIWVIVSEMFVKDPRIP